MILAIQQYIEALTNNDGRFRTLGKVLPVMDTAGNPLFAMPGHGLADFEAMIGETRFTLRCPLRYDAETANRLQALRDKDKGLGSRFFTEWDLLEKELILFDSAGKSVEVDILIRPGTGGERMADFLQRTVSSESPAEKILAALRSFGEMAEWALNNGCDKIVARKVSVSARGEVCVTGFSANDESPVIALAFLFTAAMPGRFAGVGLPLISGLAAARPLAERLCAASSETGFPEPAQILAGDVAGGVRRLSEYSAEEIAVLGAKLSVVLGESEAKAREETAGYSWREDGGDGIKCVRDGGGWRYVDRRNRPVIDTVWLRAAPFREGRAEVEAATGKGLIDKGGRAVLEPVYEELAWDDYFGLTAVMKDGRWSLLDRDGMLLTADSYDWLGECSEGLILAQKEGRCGFIDAEGREVIPCIYDDATSFSEGCAFVTSGEEDFYIDPAGRKL